MKNIKIYKVLLCCAFLSYIALVFNGQGNCDDIVTATISVGDDPRGIDVNTATNSIYTANLNDNTVSVISGDTGSIVATVNVGNAPIDLAVNSTTNLIYVSNSKDDNVTVIDGATNSITATIIVGDNPGSIALNPDTNTIYVLDGNDFVNVIDGVTNQGTATVSVGDKPGGIDVNPVTNRIYVSNFNDDTVTVIDGITNGVVKTVNVGNGPFGVSVNPVLNQIYVSNFNDDTVTVIDGVTSGVAATVKVGDGPLGIGINPATNRIYVSNSNDDTVTVIDGEANVALQTIQVGNSPLGVGVNKTTNFVYVANLLDDSVTVVQAGFDPGIPVLTSINPLFGRLGENVNVTLTGSNFAAGMVINAGGPGITATDITVNSGVAASAVFNISKSVPASVMSISVTTDNGTSESIDFTVGGSELVTVFPVGDGPADVDVNSTTNHIYVCNSSDNRVRVIDGITHTIAETIDVGEGPVGVSANSTTNLVYVTNQIEGTVSIIDGAVNSVTGSVAVGNKPSGIKVNSTTNFIYVADSEDNTVSVIDGAINGIITTINVGTEPVGVGVNIATNRIYVINRGDKTISVIDGEANEVIGTINIGKDSTGIDVHTTTNRIYVTHEKDNAVSVIDGGTNSIIKTIKVQNSPIGVAVNHTTNLVYVTHKGDDTVSVIDVTSNRVIGSTIGNGTEGITVNSITNLIYMTNFDGDYITVIKDVVEAGLPLLVLISPSSAFLGDTVSVNLVGANFKPEMTVNVSGTGVAVTNLDVNSNTEAVAVFDISPSATAFVRNVNVTTETGTSNSIPFEVVTPLFPELFSITPKSSFVGKSTTITLTGSNFTSDMFINVSEDGVTVSDVNVASNTTATAIFNIAGDARTGVMVVKVTTGSGGSSNELFFTIDPLFPVLSTMSPDSSFPGEVIKVFFTGANFTNDISINVNRDGIKVSDVKFSSATNASAVFNVSRNASQGPRNVRVINREGTSNSLVFTVVSKPEADFSMDRHIGISPLTVSFLDRSKGEIDRWFWDFGDGSISTQQNPSHTYVINGVEGRLLNIRNITVTLTVVASGGTDSKNKHITIYPTRGTR